MYTTLGGQDLADKKIQWHQAFTAAVCLEFSENRDDLIYEKEYNLNTKPLEIDLLVIKKQPHSKIRNEIDGCFVVSSPVKSTRDSIRLEMEEKKQKNDSARHTILPGFEFRPCCDQAITHENI